MDINSEKTVWEKYYYEQNEDFLKDDSYILPPIVNEVLYIPVTMDYDVAKDFGAEIVGIDAISGQIIMMTRRVEIYYPRITNEKTSVLEILSYG
ncbi:MAG: hypothetical protein ACP5SP_05535, partial [Caldisericum sp.]|uniref:hypothetical protein n=1 Tax=Caldisericum sp. TaxID=2499687 RepID=UPI003D0DD9FF